MYECTAVGSFTLQIRKLGHRPPRLDVSENFRFLDEAVQISEYINR